MNNGYVSFFEEEMEEPKDTSEEQARLTRLIEAINNLLTSRDWQVLQEFHFVPEESRLTRLLLLEAKKSEVELDEIYRLQGELKWAKRYADLKVFGKFLKNQLDKLKHE